MLDQRALAVRTGGIDLRAGALDPCRRRMIFGPVRPMERPSLLRRLLGG
ncbi:MAG: hypothetical protein P0Y56_00790 [Candidatus Andeanibacterium colombiense]|uniref:Uncharacterized protein n=1 Tax=Candidatus Andeanibacterium colombiense TaxID=3121345 RepID=A0AAJ6BP83_9SPHN|nr:MAG: hypothetical protein P0Y56_00790 [Sphingomonadaceae bacterium]